MVKGSEDRYLSGHYLAQNPTWDEEDSPWKAAKIAHLLKEYQIAPKSLCEVGCGAGGVLAALREHLGPECLLVGYDIATPLEEFWQKHASKRIKFILGDFVNSSRNDFYDVLLMIDVLEHLENPLGFLRSTLRRANWLVLHIPLEIHALGALRSSPFLRAYHKIGHLHYWNKDLALSMLSDCGLQPLHWEYTAGTVELPTALRLRQFARWPRKFCFAIAPDLAVRALGGYSLLVLAKPY
jgi:SAM-dependent methyltransferase